MLTAVHGFAAQFSTSEWRTATVIHQSAKKTRWASVAPSLIPQKPELSYLFLVLLQDFQWRFTPEIQKSSSMKADASRDFLATDRRGTAGFDSQPQTALAITWSHNLMTSISAILCAVLGMRTAWFVSISGVHKRLFVSDNVTRYGTTGLTVKCLTATKRGFSAKIIRLTIIYFYTASTGYSTLSASGLVWRPDVYFRLKIVLLSYSCECNW